MALRRRTPTWRGTPMVPRSFRRDGAVLYYRMLCISRSAPGKSAPFVQTWHRQTKQQAPLRTSQLTRRPLPPMIARLSVGIRGSQLARYGPTKPVRVDGCRLWLLAPLRVCGKTPSGLGCVVAGCLRLLRARGARFSSPLPPKWLAHQALVADRAPTSTVVRATCRHHQAATATAGHTTHTTREL